MGDWNFGYDNLSRLTSGTAANGTYAGQWGCWGYDSYGNRTMQVVGSQPCNVASPTATYNARNQVSFVSQQSPSPVSAANGFTYDAGGNVINDGLNQYAYDAEGRLCAMEAVITDSMTEYVYDAGGNRVAKGSITTLNCNISSNGFTLTNQYLVGANGEQVTELSGTPTWQHSNVWAGASLTATYDPKGLHLHVKDPLGTRRVQLNAQGAVEGTCQNLPFGDALTCTPTALSTADDATEHHFTSKEYDAESGNDYFLARYYGSSMGRFLSPDPSGLYYADQGNPQSFNLYAYVLNNPLKFIDPTGMILCDYGSNDSGGEDYEDADDEHECTNNGGSVVKVQQSVTVDGNDSSDSDTSTDSDAPNNGEPPSTCLAANIAAVNQVSNLNVNMSNVVGQPFIYNGGLDVNFSVPGGSPSQLPVGRYSSSILGRIFGFGSSLHVPGPGGADPSTYGVDANGNFTFTTHIDSAYATWHTPIGAIIHYFTDVRGQGAHRKPC
jgi:RHS repeat-associated protein